MYNKRLFNLIIAAALLIGTTLTIREAAATLSVTRNNTGDSTAAEMLRIQRANTAYTSRLNAQAEYFEKSTDEEAARVMRVRAAETARWNAQAEYFATKEAQRVERVREAETARWNAMAEFYGAK